MQPARFATLTWPTCIVAEVAHRTVDALPPEWEVTRLAQRLREHLPELRARYGLESVALFGSYVRNEQRPDSDLDVLVVLSRTLSLFDRVELGEDLENALGVPVDVALRDRLQPRLARYILREVVDV
jgi:predicted nucleotidyltransferase